MSEIKIIELKIDDLTSEIKRISLVSEPAIEDNWMIFSKMEQKFELQNEEKRLIVGPVMIPNLKIIRLDEKTKEPFYVWFSEDTIRKCSELFFRNSDINSSNLEHKFIIDGVTVVESWIVEDPTNDKSNALGFKNVSKGTWFATYKINNDVVWNEFIKTGMVKGFSIEGSFDFKSEMKKIEELYEKIVEIIKSIDEN